MHYIAARAAEVVVSAETGCINNTLIGRIRWQPENRASILSGFSLYYASFFSFRRANRRLNYSLVHLICHTRRGLSNGGCCCCCCCCCWDDVGVAGSGVLLLLLIRSTHYHYHEALGPPEKRWKPEKNENAEYYTERG